MARPLRVEMPGGFYHVTSRGNARADIFLSDNDRHRFLAAVSEVVGRFRWLCHAYCLMNNHYHLLVETPEPNLSAGMRQLNGVYTQAFNRANERTGHIFQGRFKAVLIEKDHHLLELCRYVVLNPVRAGLAKAPSEWAWSSYRATSGMEAGPAFLTTMWILGCFAKTHSAAQRAYKNFVSDGIQSAGSPWERLSGQIYLGDEEFLEEVHEYVRGKQEIGEIPRQQRIVARPALEEIFAPLTKPDKQLRNHLITEAHEKHAYSLKAIAASLGLHYTTISKVINTKK